MRSGYSRGNGEAKDDLNFAPICVKIGVHTGEDNKLTEDVLKALALDDAKGLIAIVRAASGEENIVGTNHLPQVSSARERAPSIPSSAPQPAGVVREELRAVKEG